ncbi:hypothetical protein Hsc_1487 [Herbaspirillum seropedicae]|nr:hypothetical protein Hsc_1487 [Herbaspirillum seropedicae]
MLLAGLSWPADTTSGYWQGLAIAWLEEGAHMDAALAELVRGIAATEKFPQNLRHRARTIVSRFDWANSSVEKSP